MTIKVHKISTGAERALFVETMLSGAVFSFHKLENTNYTICVATFKDNWTQTGQSVCVSDADYNQQTGERIAKENALREAETHYWRVAGYLAMIGEVSITHG